MPSGPRKMVDGFSTDESQIFFQNDVGGSGAISCFDASPIWPYFTAEDRYPHPRQMIDLLMNHDRRSQDYRFAD